MRIQIVIQLVYAAVIVMGVVLAGILSRYRGKRGATALLVTNLAIAFWAVCLFVTTVAGDQWTIFMLKLTYVGVGIAVASMFVFVLEYTGQEEYVTTKSIGLLAVHPVCVSVVAVLNPGDLFFTGFDMSVAAGGQQEWGPLFWLHAGYSYILIGIMAFLILDLVLRSRQQLFQGQAVALLLALLGPAIMNILFLSGGVAFDATLLGFISTASCFTFAIVRYDLVNITPLAQEKLIGSVRDGMLVVDTEDQVVDSNPAAKEILGIEESVVGRTAGELFTDRPTIQQVYEELTAGTEPAEQTVSIGEQHLHIDASPVTDNRGRQAGWLLLLQDISEQKHHERDLEQQIEKLDEFASLVSHDLRNPLGVASGYIQQTKATGELEYLEKAEEATERMETIIDDVLALAREKRDVTDPTATVVETVTNQAWENVETGAATLDVQTDVTIVADPERLTRLFENLFRNAIEHGVDPSDPAAPNRPELTVTVSLVSENHSEVTMYVADNGVGIPETKQDQVFDDSYTTGGTGLGLSIVEQIADAHGWDVTATNRVDLDRSRTAPGDSRQATVAETDSVSRESGACFEISGISKPF